MIQCIQYRKSTFLGNPEWLTLPWGKKGKDIYQQLYDKGFLLGALLEDIDNAGFTKDNNTVSVVSGFLGRLSSLDEDLNLWFRDLLQESPSPLYWQIESTSSSKHLKENIQPRSSFAFHNLRSANIVVKYWGLRIILSSTIALTCQRVLSMTTQLPAHPTSSTLPPILQDLHNMSHHLLKANSGLKIFEFATNIVRSMPYCLNENMGLIGAQKSLFPMRIALFVLQRHPGEDLKWCQAMYQELNSGKGIRYAREIGKHEKWPLRQ